MLEAKALTKQYGFLTALDHLDLNVAPGETFGLLGPNGAGKTTTLRLMAGLSQPSEGSVRVGGVDPWKEPERARQSMGVLLDGTGLFDRLTVGENLALFAGLYGLPASSVAAALEKTGIADLTRRRVGQLSKGQRQRVALARAIIHNPSLLFLDEPTSGLDPTAVASFHQLLGQLKQRGVTILLASHDMSEVDLLCDRVAILDRGRLMACGTPASLKAAYGRRSVIALVETPQGTRQVEWDLDGADAVEQYAACTAMGRILSLRSNEASMAEVFVHVTGRELA